MEGLQVIADLHGGDTDDPIAMAVYQEIKDKVREVVGISHISKSTTPLLFYLNSENLEKEDLIDKCGRSTSDVCFLQCRR